MDARAVNEIRELLTGGDRRSIEDSKRARALIERDPARVAALASLVADDNWLIALRSLDLLEKLAHEKHVEKILTENVAFPQTFGRACLRTSTDITRNAARPRHRAAM